MVHLRSDEIDLLKKQRHGLIRQHDRKEIDDKEFNNRIGEIDTKVEEKLRVLLDANDVKIKQTEMEAMNKMGIFGNKRPEQSEQAQPGQAQSEQAQPGQAQPEQAQTSEQPAEQPVKEKKRGKKISVTSYTMIIIETLKKKGLKDVEVTADKVLEIKPGRDKNKVVTHIRKIIYLIKKQYPKRWQAYNWDEEAYLLTEK